MNKKFCQYGVTIANCCCDKDCIDCPKGKEDDIEIRKPPIGLKPRYIHDEQRRTDILFAMERYSDANMPIPKEWIEELKEICERYN